MTKLDSVQEIIKKERLYLSTEYGIKKIGVFGSVTRQTEHDDSDIDITIELAQPLGLKFNELVEYFELLLNTKVDVLTKDGINNIRNKKISDDIKRTIIYV